MERQSSRPGSFSSSWPLKNFKGCSVSACFLFGSSYHGGYTCESLPRLRVFFSPPLRLCSFSKDTWGPGLAHLVFPSTHMLFSMPTRGHLGAGLGLSWSHTPRLTLSRV